MIKKMLLILGLMILSSPGQAYDFSSLNASQPSSETGKSVVFKKAAPTPAAAPEKEPVPQPQAPVIPQRIKLYNGNIKIVALVNGEIISTEDMENRVNAFVMTTQIPLNHQTKNLIKQRVLQAAIDEKLKIQDAEKNGINIQPKTLVAGGNDAGTIHKSCNGVKTIAVSLPCRYIHSASSVADTRDMKSCYDLATALLKEYANDN